MAPGCKSKIPVWAPLGSTPLCRVRRLGNLTLCAADTCLGPFRFYSTVQGETPRQLDIVCCRYLFGPL